MKRNERDETLAEDFQAIRAELEASGRVPAFEAMLERARTEADDAAATGGRARSDVTRWRRLWAPLAAAAAFVGLLLVGLPGSDASDADAEFERLVADYSASVSGGAWRSPTASLLDLPGVDLGSVPSFGGSLRGGAPPGSDVPDGRDS